MFLKRNRKSEGEKSKTRRNIVLILMTNDSPLAHHLHKDIFVFCARVQAL